MRIFIIIFLSSCLLLSCKGNKPDISDINVTIEIQRLDKDMFEKDAASLHDKYGTFLNYYTHDILGIGYYYDTAFEHNRNEFKNAEVVQIAYKDVGEQYPDLTDLNQKLTTAFKYYKYYFPEKFVPEVYSYISGFNQSIMLTDSVIGVSLDKYLGAGYKVYDELGFSKYLSRNMTREKIPSDCISTWIGSECFLDYRKNNNLLSKMLHEGKILYTTKLMLPDEADTLIFGFTADQLKWCNNNEGNMWVHLIDKKLLFSTDHVMIRKLTEDAPYTTEFTPESPGKACNWIGYKIITSYMKKYPDITLKQLLEDQDFDNILVKSKYRP